ncbi:acyl-CoA dehydrogenase family protein [Gordonia sp. CPCC 205333]|uniref:acyl-CoA dehydrogenase family protein n=1 Tax=Gordonia sp. CPCC 205333 TaxID=3140790 RepID=UPI003AF3DA1E
MTIAPDAAVATGLRVSTTTEAALEERFAPIFARIARDNVERERTRAFPYDEVTDLKDAGFGRLRIPENHGGLGASLEQTFVLLARLAEADPNVAHVFRNHLAFVEDRLNAPASQSVRWLERFRDGDFVGGGWTEAGNGTLANIATRVERDGNRHRVTGAKFYATGSLYADWLDVLGKTDDGAYLTLLVRRDDAGVTLTDDWDGFGQQTTASGSATYEGAQADSSDVFDIGERFVYQGPFYQVAILSVLTGIIRAALRDGVAALRERGRNYPQGLDPVPARDPQLLQVIGEVSQAGFAAEAALRHVARSLDRLAAAIADRGRDAVDDIITEAQVATDQAQAVVVRNALEATTHIFDALGSSGVSKTRLLDRHWRNARTLSSHNPVVYKSRIIGDWLVNGTDPVPRLTSSGRGGQGN